MRGDTAPACDRFPNAIYLNNGDLAQTKEPVNYRQINLLSKIKISSSLQGYTRLSLSVYSCVLYIVIVV